MSRQARQPHDPLRGTWRAGQEPAPEPTPAPQQQQEDVDTSDYSIGNREWMLQLRAVNIIKRMYGLRGPFDWKPAIHDRKAKAVLNKLMAGEPIPDHWRTQYVEPPPIDPATWITPRQSSR
jgi:hypothetical protein